MLGDTGAVARHEGQVVIQVGSGEVHHGLAGVGDGDRRDAQIALRQGRAGLDGLEGAVHDAQFGTEVFGELLGDVHVEADRLAVLLEFERLVRNVGADRQLAGVDELDAAFGRCRS
jgi:hypothetical protein